MANYSFKPSTTAWLMAVLTIPLFVALGFWQLQRAEQKQGLNDLRQNRTQDEIIKLDGTAPDDAESLRYRRVRIEGIYDGAHQFLIDNQIQGGAAGFHVLTPFRLRGSDKAILVNRGWIPLGSDRQALPDIGLPPDAGESLTGMIDLMHRVGFQLSGADTPTAGWPSLVQVPNPDRLAERLGYPLLPYQVLLSPEATAGFSRKWQVSQLDPGKNRGYALQWFLFAAVAAIIFIRHGLISARR